jgi:hypothetical protein
LIPSQSPSLSRCEPQGFEHHTLGIYEQVTFPAFDLLAAAVVTALFSSQAGALYRLAVYYARALGSGSRFLRTRTRFLRKAACTLSQVPSRRQVLK